MLAFRTWSCSPLRAPLPDVSDDALGCRIVRVHQQGDHAGLGNQLGKQLEPLGRQLGRRDADAGEVAARPGEAGDQAQLDRVAAVMKTIGIVEVALLRRACTGSAAVGHDHVDLAADEVGSQVRAADQ